MTEQTATTNGAKNRAARTMVSADETKEEKFVRLAVQRMNALKGKVRQVKNLARYPHTEDQGKRIVSEIKGLANDIEEAFGPRVKKDDFTF